MQLATRLATVAAAALIAILAFGGSAGAKQVLAPGYVEVMKVVNSTELSPSEKAARLKEMVAKEQTRWVALNALDNLDPPEAIATAMLYFRDAASPVQQKLRMGHFILERNRPQREGFPQAFVQEFAQYLLGAVLDHGEREFCQKLDGLSLTAVGEYAYLASGFQGYMNIDFAPFKDSRVVPVLIHCLDAPDTVYAKDQGDLIRGKPGESTGRNTARQQIPLALAKLADDRAVEPLNAVLFKHADIYGRMNAAYALARLLKQKQDRAAIGRKLLAKPELLWCRFPFGKGLIETGDDAGVEFLAIRHAGGYGRLEYPYQILSLIESRLNVLKGFRSPQVEGFIREALAWQPLRGMLLFEPGSVKIDTSTYRNSPKDKAEALEREAPRIVRVYGAMLACVETNGFKSLFQDLAEIARKTHSEKLRQMTDDSLKSLQ